MVKNKARQSCLFQATLGLIKNRNVQIPAIAEAMKLEGDTLQVKSIIQLASPDVSSGFVGSGVSNALKR